MMRGGLKDVRTTKAISSISFNSKGYLDLKLKEMTRSGIISFWAYIEHLSEDDEGGKKNHIHLFIEPSKIVQTEDIRNEFKEFDATMPDKPRGCLVFTSSKFEHWYMYVKHDKAYLTSKGQSRKFHYQHEDIFSSDFDDLLFKAKSINFLSLSPYADMLEAQGMGLTFCQYFRRGTIPIQQVKLFQASWELLLSDVTDRNDRTNHINYDENGEII